MNESVWSDGCKFEERETLNQDVKADVLVIGAGMAGLLTAFNLQKAGMDVMVIESGRIADGITKNTTAKITAQHGLIYSKLVKSFGEEIARKYAGANTKAIEEYARLTEEMSIECDFERKPAYVYSTDDDQTIEDEVEAARLAGIDAEFTTDTKLPFPVNGAVRFPDQAQFNPLKFLKAISKDLRVYERTKALEVNDGVTTTERATVKADKVVVTTHFPFINVPGYYFMRMYQQRSYVLALQNAAQVDGMYIGADDSGYSFRNYKDLLIFGGEGHRSGKSGGVSRYESLREAALRFYPDSQEVYRWSAQDCMSLDGIPYIGRYASSTPELFVATGFNKWGMTSSMVSAMLLSDLITGHDNEFAEAFDPARFNVSASAKNLVTNGAQTISSLISETFSLPDEELEKLPKGQGGIVEHDGEKVGVYRDEDGRAFVVTTKCPHLGCQLEWNQDELSWDCPCHGSRFDYTGKLLDDPALKGLQDE